MTKKKKSSTVYGGMLGGSRALYAKEDKLEEQLDTFNALNTAGVGEVVKVSEDFIKNTTMVDHPEHYTQLDGVEVIDIIRIVLDSIGVELTGFEAHCLATYLKYRLRAGDKGDLEEDIAKSNVYRDWFNESRGA